MSGILHGQVITAPAATIITMVTTAAAVPLGMVLIVQIMVVTAATVVVAEGVMVMAMEVGAITPPEATITSLRS